MEDLKQPDRKHRFVALCRFTSAHEWTVMGAFETSVEAWDRIGESQKVRMEEGRHFMVLRYEGGSYPNEVEAP